MTLLNDWVLIDPVAMEEMTPGGIVLPEDSKKKPVRGKVLLIGPGKRRADGIRDPLAIKIGDSVVHSKHAGTGFDYEGRTVKLMPEGEIIAIL